MKNRPDRLRKRGVTLVEVMLAGCLFAFLILSLFEGIAVAARISRENAEYLQADAYAFDLAWKRFNEDYTLLAAQRNTFEENIASNAAPLLYIRGSEAKSITRIAWGKNKDGGVSEDGILISVDVEWGPAARRRKLSNTHTATVYKSSTGSGGD